MIRRWLLYLLALALAIGALVWLILGPGKLGEMAFEARVFLLILLSLLFALLSVMGPERREP